MRKLTVLIAADHEDRRLLFVETLTTIGCIVRATASYDEVLDRATETPIDVAVLDIRFDATAFAVAAQLAALPNRPRLIALTDRATNGPPLEQLFDLCLGAPCLPDDLIEAVDSVARAPLPNHDLVIIAREGATPDAVHYFGDIGARVEIRVDQRYRERRRPARRSTTGERRRSDRRACDVSDRLSAAGWAFVPSAQRPYLAGRSVAV